MTYFGMRDSTATCTIHGKIASKEGDGLTVTCILHNSEFMNVTVELHTWKPRLIAKSCESLTEKVAKNTLRTEN